MKDSEAASEIKSLKTDKLSLAAAGRQGWVSPRK